jgi:hypothetical protein
VVPAAATSCGGNFGGGRAVSAAWRRWMGQGGQEVPGLRAARLHSGSQLAEQFRQRGRRGRALGGAAVPLRLRGGLHAAFGRVVASENEAPNLSVNLV